MLRVGLIEQHGIADEYADFPPPDVSYTFVRSKKLIFTKLISSAAKGIYDYFDDEDIDLYEAPIFPILTPKNWIYYPAEYSGSANFGLLGVPLPKSLRLRLVEQNFEKRNFKKLIFKSRAGLDTLFSYGQCESYLIKDKSCVVYPAINLRRIKPKENNNPKTILFSGAFFRKGGANVVDVFLQLSTEFSNLELRLCCPEHLHTTNNRLRNEYQKKIFGHSKISIGQVSRTDMLNKILPQADVFVSPTYKETFGFAILEAMSFGIPVISTNIFAIPEIIETNKDGILLDIKKEDFIVRHKGYVVNNIDKNFHEQLNEKLYNSLKRVLTDSDYRYRLGENAIAKCATKFSPERRAIEMLKIYQEI